MLDIVCQRCAPICQINNNNNNNNDNNNNNNNNNKKKKKKKKKKHCYLCIFFSAGSYQLQVTSWALDRGKESQSTRSDKEYNHSMPFFRNLVPVIVSTVPFTL